MHPIAFQLKEEQAGKVERPMKVEESQEKSLTYTTMFGNMLIKRWWD